MDRVVYKHYHRDHSYWIYQGMLVVKAYVKSLFVK